MLGTSFSTVVGMALPLRLSAGLIPGRRGSKGLSKLTVDIVADIRARRGQPASLRFIAAQVRVSVASIRRVLAEDKPAGDAPGPAPSGEPEMLLTAPWSTQASRGRPSETVGGVVALTVTIASTTTRCSTAIAAALKEAHTQLAAP